MTLLGKIFTLLIFIMSLVFMAFAVMVYATHKNWKQIVLNEDAGKGQLGYKKQLTDQVEVNRNLRDEIETMKSGLAFEKAARAAALSALETKLSQEQEKLVAEERKYADLLKAHGEATAQLDVQQKMLEKHTTEVARLRTEIREAQKEGEINFDRMVKLTDQLYQAEGLLARMEDRRKVLEADLAQHQAAMKMLKTTPQLVLSTATASLDGLVMDVQAVGERIGVEVSLGTDQGLKSGDHMEVFRGRQYLGRIKIREVTSQRAVGDVLPDTLQGEIRKGDRVITKVT